MEIAAECIGGGLIIDSPMLKAVGCNKVEKSSEVIVGDDSRCQAKAGFNLKATDAYRLIATARTGRFQTQKKAETLYLLGVPACSGLR